MGYTRTDATMESYMGYTAKDAIKDLLKDYSDEELQHELNRRQFREHLM